MSKFIIRALINQHILIYGDGFQTRTFCYVDDNIQACVNAFENDLYINDVINIGSAYEMSILKLAEKLIDTTKSKSKIVRMPPLEEGDMKRRLPDITKMLQLLGRKPIKIDDGIKMVLENPLFLEN